MESAPLKRTAVYAALFLLFFIETVMPEALYLFGCRPELLLVAVIFFGFNFGFLAGIEIGAISGILKDTLSVGTFGVNAISFSFIGFLAGYLKDKLFKENIIAQFFFSGLAVYFISAVYFFGPDKLKLAGADGEFWHISFYKALYTGALAPLLFFIFARIFKRCE